MWSAQWHINVALSQTAILSHDGNPSCDGSWPQCIVIGKASSRQSRMAALDRANDIDQFRTND